MDGIEAGADVTDTTNVTAAGALMDSEVDADIKTLILPANTTISAFGKTLIDDANAAAARTTLDAGIVFQCSGSVSPADATTYYFGGHNFAIALADYSRIYIPRAGTIKRIDVNQLVTPTVGSSETSTISLRLNNTTDHTITSAFQQDLAGEVFTNSALSIAVVAGDYFEIKWLTPTWVTDPSIVYLSFTIYVE